MKPGFEMKKQFRGPMFQGWRETLATYLSWVRFPRPIIKRKRKIIMRKRRQSRAASFNQSNNFYNWQLASYPVGTTTQGAEHGLQS